MKLKNFHRLAALGLAVGMTTALAACGNTAETAESTAETAERDALRKEYLTDMRASFRQQLDNTYVQTADGAKIPYAEYAKLSKKTSPAGEVGREAD